MTIIDIKNLKFSYNSEVDNIIDIKSFSINRGEKIFLYGPSGSGKTTFLEIIAGVLAPQSGIFSFLNYDIIKKTPTERDKIRAAHIGYIFQSFNLIPYLNVEENIALPLYLSLERRKKISQKSESKEIQRICERLGISDLISRSIPELSVGEQQRVAVARALLGKPELILADEPTSALDYDHREKFINFLFDICNEEKTTVLFVSHDRSLLNFFDRAIALIDINQGGKK